MTSTPASRSARATTFAPRSWPSSPTFATITRILPMPLSVAAGAPCRAEPGARGGPGGSSLPRGVWGDGSPQKERPARSVHAGDAVLRGDRAALRTGGRGGRHRGGGRWGGRGEDGVRAEQDLDVTGRDRRARRRGHAEHRRDRAGAGRRARSVRDLGRGQRAARVCDLSGLVAVLDQRGRYLPGEPRGVAAVVHVHRDLAGALRDLGLGSRRGGG